MFYHSQSKLLQDHVHDNIIGCQKKKKIGCQTVTTVFSYYLTRILGLFESEMFKVSIKSGKRETNTVEATYWEICICFQVIRSLDTFVHYYLKYNWDHEYHSSLKYHRSRGEVTSSRGSPPKGPTPHNEKGQMYPPAVTFTGSKIHDITNIHLHNELTSKYVKNTNCP